MMNTYTTTREGRARVRSNNFLSSPIVCYLFGIIAFLNSWVWWNVIPYLSFAACSFSRARLMDLRYSTSILCLCQKQPQTNPVTTLFEDMRWPKHILGTIYT